MILTTQSVVLVWQLMSCYPSRKKSVHLLTFRDISEGKSVGELLDTFKHHPGMTATSKVKYLKMFERLVKFLICDCCSPERNQEDTVSEQIARKVKIEDFGHEMTATYDSLKKKRGEDQVATRKRAKERIVEVGDLQEILVEVDSHLEEVGRTPATDLKKFKEEDVLQVRNSLMVAACIRLGRRSKELMTMTIDEVNAAEEKIIDGNTFHIIQVKDQKSLKQSKEAAIPYSVLEFNALNLYIEHLRPIISNDRFNNSVFIPKLKLKCSISQELGFSSAYNILQKFRTKSGKKLSTRMIRGSNITNSRNTGVTDQERRDLAQSMNHSVETAERYYNFTSLSDSVANSLSLLSKHSAFDTDNSDCLSEKAPSPQISSTPIKAATSTQYQEDQKAGPSGMSMKRKSRSLDTTLKTLRGKKNQRSKYSR